ncbi:hypothetical protein FK85_24935, partial [Halorubrum saccharovorum]
TGRREGGRDRRAPDRSDDRREGRASENGHRATRSDGTVTGNVPDDRDDRRGSEGRERNGGSPRPMNDPNPRSDRADPADGGWGDGR